MLCKMFYLLNQLLYLLGKLLKLLLKLEGVRLTHLRIIRVNDFISANKTGRLEYCWAFKVSSMGRMPQAYIDLYFSYFANNLY